MRMLTFRRVPFNLAPMRAFAVKIKSVLNLDKMGIFLSFLCAVHCVLTPIIMLSLPIMARYYLAHPLFHLVLALFIFPIGFLAFYQGYQHHRRALVFYLGVPGLLIVSVVPTFFHEYLNMWTEPILMVLGSALLVLAHWTNRRSCSCEIHQS